jgi:hypothetical protein
MRFIAFLLMVAAGSAKPRLCSLQERVQSPGQGFGGFRNPATPSVKKPILALRQKIFRTPAPLVAVPAQGFVILGEVGELALQGVKFGLDDAQAREE